MHRIIAALIILIFAFPALAADICSGPTATGNGSGSDWNNRFAFNTGTLVRGNTYYLASGTYAPRQFTTAESGSTYVYIKKATESAHGSNTGWSSSLDSGPALFTTSSATDMWYFTTGYWDIDGVRGYFKGATEAYGIEIKYTGSGVKASATEVPETFKSGYLNFSHIKIYTDDVDTTYADGFAFTPTEGSFHYINISYCYINEIVLPFNFKTWNYGTGPENAHNITIEYCVARNNLSNQTTPGHSEGLVAWSVDTLTVRYSWFESMMGTGIFAYNDAWGTGATGWEIYGNIFLATNSRMAEASWTAYQGGLVNPNGHAFNNAKIYNNTMYNQKGAGMSNPTLGYLFDASSNNTWRNNLYYDNGGIPFYYSESGTGNVCSHEYRNATSWSGMDNIGCTSVQTATGNPFVSVTEGSENFSLVANTTAGYTLPAPYNEDGTPKLLGGPTATNRTRGSGQAWSRGAVQYGTGGSSDTTPDPFSFTDITNASRSTVYTSNTITVSGIDASTAVSVSGGTYSKNGGAYTSAAGTAVLGDTFALRVTSSASYSTAVSATLTIGGVGDTYTVTTLADTVPAFIDNLSPSGVLACTSNPRSVTLSLTTDEAATARMNPLSDTTYALMTDTFTTTGGTSHSETKSLACGSSYLYYVRTSDSAGNVNTTGSVISFTISNPQIAGPGGLRIIGGRVGY